MLVLSRRLGEKIVLPTLGITIAELWSRFDRAAHPMQRVALPGPAARP